MRGASEYAKAVHRRPRQRRRRLRSGDDRRRARTGRNPITRDAGRRREHVPCVHDLPSYDDDAEPVDTDGAVWIRGAGGRVCGWLFDGRVEPEGSDPVLDPCGGDGESPDGGGKRGAVEPENAVVQLDGDDL